jgi:NADPH2:quinone reductase
MKAIVCRNFGNSAEVLELAEIPSPPLVAGGVRIKVAAAGVNFADTLMIGGKYQVKPELPFVPGFELAGTVLETAPGVDHVKPGDRVLATVGPGAFAEEAVAKAEETVPIPDAMDFVTAATFPVAYGTSHLGLTHKARLQAGETLLVHGAAGGVGITAVECAKAMGATVIATAGGQDKVKVALEHGADFGIDYKAEDFVAIVKERFGGVDVVYDPVGGEIFDKSLRAVKAGGRILVVGFASGTTPQIPANILLVKNIDVLGYYWGGYRAINPRLMRDSLAECLKWWAQGKLKTHVSHQLPLSEAAKALDLLKSRGSTGKVALLMG